MFLRLAGLIALVCASGAALPQTLSPADRQANLDSFEHVWKTVRDKHWDPKLGGLDWQAVHDELRPKEEAATTMEQARAPMSAMLDRLHQTHFAIVPATVYHEMDAPGSMEGNPGIDVRVIDGQVIVTSVEPDSPAARRGVKPGWRIMRVNGNELEPRLNGIRKQFPNSTLLDIMQTRSVTSRMRGAAGNPVKVDFLDEKDQPVALELDRAQPRGTVARFGNLPPMYFWVESRNLSANVGYVRFSSFFEPETLVKAVQEQVKNCVGCAGFVIDLRGNPGGIGGLAMGLAGWFTDKGGQQLGTMYMRDSTIKFVIFPRPEPFQGPLAVLVDGCSGSTSEIFAGGLKDLGRARIFGTRSAGAALPSIFERLPNGDGFQYAIANYISQGGKALEGNGVTPDEEVKLTRRSLLDGRDAVLEAALSWIQKQKK
jgi:carboxyl-terminal processing protease